ncbi:Rv3654c family TadE-like protein, partial [Streptomyces sp. NPDC002454]
MRAPHHHPRPGDRGAATVWAVTGIAVLMVVFTAVLALGQAATVRHRAAAAADLAALAAADRWADGPAAACARARTVAGANGARVLRCALAGEVAEVRVAVGRPPLVAEDRARAGPPGAPPL